MITVIPNGGIVRDPGNQYRQIPESGIEVDENDSYWQRRLLDKDVIIKKEKKGRAE